MRDIRFYDFEFNLLHIENRFISLNWSVYYNNIGTFEAHFDRESEISKILFENDYLVAVQGNLAAIITGKTINEDVAVYGRTCNWILSRRTTPRFSQRTGNVEELARSIVTDAFSDVQNFYLGETAGFSSSIDFWRNTCNPTSDVVRECLDNDGGGHEVAFDTVNRRWIFRCLRGSELALIVSEDNKNAYDTEYSVDLLDSFTCGWYELPPEINTDESQNQTVDTVWEYVAGDTTKTGIYRWEAPLSGTCLSEAEDDLKQKSRTKTLKTKTRGVILGRDYSLGDTVRVKLWRGGYRTAQRIRIIGANIWYEHNDCGEQPIFKEEKQ